MEPNPPEQLINTATNNNDNNNDDTITNTSSSLPPPQPSPPMPPPQTLTNPTRTIHIELTHQHLSTHAATSFTRSPTAGANILFIGTTRSYFRDPTVPVTRLSYSAYTPLALRTLLSLSQTVAKTHGLDKIYVAHRLGDVAVEEESIIVAVSSPHRGEGWRAAEELLEKIKEKAEIWKREWFIDGVVTEGKDGAEGGKVMVTDGPVGGGGVDGGNKKNDDDDDHRLAQPKGTRTEIGRDGEEVGVWRDNRESDNMGRLRTVQRGEGGGE